MRAGAVFLLGFGLIAPSCARSPVGPAGSVTLTAPAYAAPANGERIAAASQPVTLVLRNATVIGSGVNVTYRVEVAIDAGFSQTILSVDVPAGGGGQTRVALGTLSAAQYFWRARTEAGGGTSPFSQPISFTIAP